MVILFLHTVSKILRQAYLKPLRFRDLVKKQKQWKLCSLFLRRVIRFPGAFTTYRPLAFKVQNYL